MFGAYRHKARLERLIRQWTDYRGLVLTRLGTGDAKPSEERNFLNQKGQIAEALAKLTGDLNQSVAQDAHTHLRAMNSLLNRYPTLYADQPLEGKDREDFEREWHDHFLFFNKLKGMQSEGQGQEATGSRTIPPNMVAAGDTIHRTGSGSRLSNILIRIVVVVGLGFLLIRLIPWNMLTGDYPRTNSGGLQNNASNFWTSIKETFANISSGSVGFLEPVTSQYGPEVTLVLVALILIGAGYFIFARMR